MVTISSGSQTLNCIAQSQGHLRIQVPWAVVVPYTTTQGTWIHKWPFI